MGESFKDPNMKQALTPYHPLAIRNRLPVVFDNAPIPRARFCFPRNNHTYDFFKAGNTPAGFQTYRTTNGNFYGNDTRVLDVGDNNAGIVVRACPIAPACGVFGCPTVALQSAGYPRLKLLISFTCFTCLTIALACSRARSRTCPRSFMPSKLCRHACASDGVRLEEDVEEGGMRMNVERALEVVDGSLRVLS